MRDHSNSRLSSDLETHQKKISHHVINLVYNQVYGSWLEYPNNVKKKNKSTCYAFFWKILKTMRDDSNSKLSSDLERHQKMMPHHVINWVHSLHENEQWISRCSVVSISIIYEGFTESSIDRRPFWLEKVLV
jgi:hypothetical protein